MRHVSNNRHRRLPRCRTALPRVLGSGERVCGVCSHDVRSALAIAKRRCGLASPRRQRLSRMRQLCPRVLAHGILRLIGTAELRLLVDLAEITRRASSTWAPYHGVAEPPVGGHTVQPSSRVPGDLVSTLALPARELDRSRAGRRFVPSEAACQHDSYVLKGVTETQRRRSRGSFVARSLRSERRSTHD